MATFRSLMASELITILQNISGIRQSLPTRFELKPHERRSMFKLNTKRIDFVKKALNFMKRYPSTVPAYVDVQHCNTCMHLYEQYSEILEELEKVKQQVEDTKHMLGNEIMKQTKAYFHHSKNGMSAGNKEYAEVYKELKPDYAVGRNCAK
ncbi:MAG TPA: hypothetical protein DIW54_11025 [Chitinophagaceae bacterium]|jgi:hypothetical protein|nr:hypothetical protein [Chitinophagaceae bacterium]